MKGIILLAIGSNEYGRWCDNLALSIRFHSPDIQIQLLHDGRATKNIDLSLYDIKTEIDYDDAYDIVKGKERVNPSKAKVNLYKYLAFDETVYLDVDALCLKPLEPLFECDKDWATQVTGHEEKDMLWLPFDKLRTHFDLEYGCKITGINSSFQFIRKSETAEKLFALSRELYHERPVPIHELGFKWGKGQPDELYTVAAIAKLGLDVDFGSQPVYFRIVAQGGAYVPIDEITKNHYLLGCWGERLHNHKSIEDYYDRLLKQYSIAKRGTNQVVKFHHLIKKKFITLT